MTPTPANYPDALAVYVASNRAELEALAHQFSPSREVCQDLVQDACVLALNRIALFNPERGDIGLWLRLHLWKAGQQYVQKDQRRKQLLSQSPTDPADTQTTEDFDTAACVELAMSQLDTTDQQIVRAHADGHSILRITRTVTGKSGAVKTTEYQDVKRRLASALERLKLLLADD